jgi:DNA-binding NarL/FixJ family response regulator
VRDIDVKGGEVEGLKMLINKGFPDISWLSCGMRALVLMRNLPKAANRSMVLYAGMAMIMGAFVCVTVAILPLLNRQLVKLLRSHAYLAVYDSMSADQQTAILNKTEPLDPLTAREQEVLEWILSGRSNREIAASLFISESTVKTHARNIFSKYDVTSRAELISTLLRQQNDT